MNVFSEQVQSAPRRAAQREKTKQHVLAVAARLFRARGFEDTSVRQIAEEAGVSVGTVMATGDKRTLLIQVFTAWIRQMHEVNATKPRQEQPDDLVEALLGLVSPFFDLFADNRELAQQYGAALIYPGDQTETMNELAGYLESEVRAVMLSHNAERLTTADAVAGLLYHLYLGHLFAWAAGRYPSDELYRQARRSIESLVAEIERKS